jgi:hypothetical protein
VLPLTRSWIGSLAFVKAFLVQDTSVPDEKSVH